MPETLHKHDVYTLTILIEQYMGIVTNLKCIITVCYDVIILYKILLPLVYSSDI